MSVPPLHALVVGIDGYAAASEGPGLYTDLEGAVHDAERVADFLEHGWGVPRERIELLRSPRGGAGGPDVPTYARLVAAFRRLGERARPGDQVWIHYSGHGGRAVTAFSDLKGPEGEDESLVPADVASPEGRYLRDLELGYLVTSLVDRGLQVTLVLDCCHAGGALRRAETGSRRVRGTAVVDRAPRSTASAVASPEELARTWNRLRRHPRASAGWLPEPRGWVLLAACRAHELAFEDVYGDAPGGALTCALLEAFERLGPGASWEEVHGRVKARVLDLTDLGQTPLLEGDRRRRTRGGDLLERAPGASVLAVDRPGRRVLLDAGAAQAVAPGDRFALFAPGSGAAEGAPRRATAEVKQRGASSSWAALVDDGEVEVEVGSPAVRVRRGAGRCRGVALVPARGVSGRVLSEIRRRLESDLAGWVEEASPGDAEFELRVEDRRVVIGGTEGRTLSEVPAAGKAGDTARAVAAHLVHLCRFFDVLDLAPSPHEVEPAGLDLEIRPGGREKVSLAAGTVIELRLKNDTGQVLNAAVFDLCFADWRIERLFPADAELFVFEPGREERLKLRMDAPPGATMATDVLKVLATTDAGRFDLLELPPIGTPVRRTHDLDDGPWWTARVWLETRVVQEGA